MTSEIMINEKAQKIATNKKINELFDDFKKRIRTSRNLAQETEEFVAAMEKILNELFNEENLQIGEIIQNILDREPDAKLRGKFGRLAEIIRSENGKVTKTQIEIGLLGR